MLIGCRITKHSPPAVMNAGQALFAVLNALKKKKKMKCRYIFDGVCDSFVSAFQFLKDEDEKQILSVLLQVSVKYISCR